jgi:hypothetical protein
MMSIIFLIDAASTAYPNPRRGSQVADASDFCLALEYDDHHFLMTNQATEVSFEGNDR